MIQSLCKGLKKIASLGCRAIASLYCSGRYKYTAVFISPVHKKLSKFQSPGEKDTIRQDKKASFS
jgi:hypothetical protein